MDDLTDKVITNIDVSTNGQIIHACKDLARKKGFGSLQTLIDDDGFDLTIKRIDDTTYDISIVLNLITRRVVLDPDNSLL